MASGKEHTWPSLSILLVMTSAVLWIASSAANTYLMSFAGFAQGIDLIYLPAGFRLLIVLLFGVWGALGIVLANPFLYLAEFGDGSAIQVIVNSLICGFAPFFAVKAFCRAADIEASLLQLKPIHLPLLALAVSVVTPVLLNVNFVVAGLKPMNAFMVNVAAMAAGDFLGCLLLIVLVHLVIAAARTLMPSDR